MKRPGTDKYEVQEAAENDETAARNKTVTQQNNAMRTAIIVLASASILSASVPAVAFERDWRRHAALLPQYCVDRLDKNGAWKNWRDYFGNVYIRMHHYCNGLYAEIRAKQTQDKRKRNFWLNQVIGEMRYVSQNCDPTCVVYAELHQRWAWALRQQGKSSEAMAQMQLMMKAQPRQAPMPPSQMQAIPQPQTQ